MALDLDYESIIQSFFTSMLAVYVIKMMLAKQKIPQRDIVQSALAAAATSYIMGNKKLSISEGIERQVWASAFVGAYAFQQM